MKPLTREMLAEGWVRRMIARAGYAGRLLADEELERELLHTLANRPDRGDLHLFAYGSLIWNPSFRFRDRAPARIHGYRRRFCLRTVVGRGTPERPGLVLALDRGGSCLGIAYRIAEAEIESELRLLFHREMITGAYRPKWLRGRMGDGRRWMLTFVVNREHERYLPDLDEETTLAMLRAGEGPLGRAADYCLETARHLAALGLSDRYLERLAARLASEERP